MLPVVNADTSSVDGFVCLHRTPRAPARHVLLAAAVQDVVWIIDGPDAEAPENQCVACCRPVPWPHYKCSVCRHHLLLPPLVADPRVHVATALLLSQDAARRLSGASDGDSASDSWEDLVRRAGSIFSVAETFVLDARIM